MLLYILLTTLVLLFTRAYKEEIFAFGGPLNDDAFGVSPALDGGFFITGYTMSYGNGNRDVWTIKINSKGNLEWDQTAGCGDDDYGSSVATTSDNGCISAGYTYCDGTKRPFLVRYSSGGNELWQKIVVEVGSQAYSVISIRDGNYIIVGYSPGNKAFIAKIEEGGIVPWNTEIVSSSTLHGVVELPNGHLTTTGWWFGNYCTLTRFDPFGNFLEVISMPPQLDRSYCYSLMQHSDGDYVMVGQAAATAGGQYSALYIKVAPDGTIVWSKLIEDSTFQEFKSVGQLLNGTMVFAGRTQVKGGNDFWVVLTDENGDVISEKIIGTNARSEVGTAMCVTEDSVVVVVGYYFTVPTSNDFYVALLHFGCVPGTYLDTTTKTCVECEIGYFQDEYEQRYCKSCTDGSFQNKTGKTTCLPCAKFCQTCIDQEHCISCVIGNEGIVYDNGICLCNSIGYFESEEHECIKCNSLCLLCYGPNADQCSSCDLARNAVYKFPDTCTCLERTYYDEKEGTCVACNVLCDKCWGPNKCEGCNLELAFALEDKPDTCVADCYQLEEGYYKEGTTCKSKYFTGTKGRMSARLQRLYKERGVYKVQRKREGGF
eukprot:TRINITY_DN4601_c0_g1_i1.p2 TRINITY_DN4601_c0_g1~~TRINITY_DN4601_c0_g1_i1.p2  ORF type:complete len:635 (-),score=31.13 TRINITY_DN4601_c0_g1_i1:2490-4286(-)